MSVITQQNNSHFYLTNASLESCGIGMNCLEPLDLDYGWLCDDGTVKNEVQTCSEFYPLSKKEYSLISRFGFITGEGYYGSTGYTTLYQGKKWLSPNIKITWYSPMDDIATDEVHATTPNGALKIARKLQYRANERLKDIGGYADIEEHAPDAKIFNQWTVAIHIPMEWAVKKFAENSDNPREQYIGFLQEIMA